MYQSKTNLTKTNQLYIISNLNHLPTHQTEQHGFHTDLAHRDILYET